VFLQTFFFDYRYGNQTSKAGSKELKQLIFGSQLAFPPQWYFGKSPSCPLSDPSCPTTGQCFPLHFTHERQTNIGLLLPPHQPYYSCIFIAERSPRKFRSAMVLPGSLNQNLSFSLCLALFLFLVTSQTFFRPSHDVCLFSSLFTIHFLF
jgi:hypothetical protein